MTKMEPLDQVRRRDAADFHREMAGTDPVGNELVVAEWDVEYVAGSGLKAYGNVHPKDNKHDVEMLFVSFWTADMSTCYTGYYSGTVCETPGPFGMGRGFTLQSAQIDESFRGKTLKILVEGYATFLKYFRFEKEIRIS